MIWNNVINTLFFLYVSFMLRQPFDAVKVQVIKKLLTLSLRPKEAIQNLHCHYLKNTVKGVATISR